MSSPKRSASSYAASTTSTEFSLAKDDSSRKSQSPSKLSAIKNSLKPESKEAKAQQIGRAHV